MAIIPLQDYLTFTLPASWNSPHQQYPPMNNMIQPQGAAQIHIEGAARPHTEIADDFAATSIDHAPIIHGSYNKCAIFWDYENSPPPSGMPGYLVVENIRKAVHHFGMITSFKAYLQIGENTKKILRSELQSSGVSLTDTPHNARKDAADKMILVDMLAFAIDHPPPATIVLISGDRDFVYALSVLRNRKYNIVLIVPNKGASPVLKSQTDVVLEWRYDVLSQDVGLAMQTSPTSMIPQISSPEKSPSSSNSSGPSLPSTNSAQMSTNGMIQFSPAVTSMNSGFSGSPPHKENPAMSRVRAEGNRPLSRSGSGNNLVINVNRVDSTASLNDPAKSKEDDEDVDPARYLYR